MDKPKKNQGSNIYQYKKPKNINIGILIFFAIFVYVTIGVVFYFNQKQIQPYVVTEGSLATSNIYTGIVMREEILVNSISDGYINYFKKEGDRTAVGDVVFAIDETNYIAGLLDTQTESNRINNQQFSDLKNTIENFNEQISTTNLQPVYQLKKALDIELIKIENAIIIDLIGQSSTILDNELLSFNAAKESGIVMYWMDGLESLTDSDISMELWDSELYEKNYIMNGDLLTRNDIAYKVCTNEVWSIVLPMEQEVAQNLYDDQYIKVRFLKNQAELWGKTSLLTDVNGQGYLKLTFTNSMISYISERFLDIEIIVNEEVGLKIPNEALVTKDFFVIPEEFIIFNGSKTQVLKESILDDGSISTVLTEVFIHYQLETETGIKYYIDMINIRSGERLYQLDSENECIVSVTGSLIGVFNMNKGYADFKHVIILYQNEQYAIVQSNTSYGLNAHDFIVLDASAISENDFIYN